MTINSHNSASVINHHTVSISSVDRCKDNRTISCRNNIAAARAAYVESCMIFPRFQYRMISITECRRNVLSAWTWPCKLTAPIRFRCADHGLQFLRQSVGFCFQFIFFLFQFFFLRIQSFLFFGSFFFLNSQILFLDFQIRLDLLQLLMLFL